ncbi:hypothetical protein ACQ4PT_003892 [Festuca glaucescens]
MPPPPRHGLARYGSAPGSFLAALSEVVRGGGPDAPAQHHQPQQQQAVSRFFSGESSGLTSGDSTSRPDVPTLHRAYGGSGEIHVPPPTLAPQQQQPGLLRHSSSPAGLLSRLVGDPHGNGVMAGTRAVMGSYSQGAGGNINVMTQQQSRLSSQWSFSGQDMMPHITEMRMAAMPGANDIGESIANGSAGGGCNSSSDLSRSFSMSSWDDTTSIMFSSPTPSKRARVAVDGDDANFSNIDSQFGLSSSSLEMPGMDEYLQMQDSIACRVRAKRGCATHPRSIAERERRTRISKRLRKLQELVPNMDKQTNTSEMLDIAVDYIKVLQEQIEKLKQDQENCSCSAKQE